MSVRRFPWFLIGCVVILAVVLTRTCRGQTPNTIVQLELVGVGSATMDAVLTSDSTLLLPAKPVAELLGLDPPTAEWTSIAELKRHWPPISVTWLPRELRVVIQDDLGVLPATRRRTDQQQRQARGAAPYYVTHSGPFAALTADDRSRTLVDVGYSWRGRIAITARRSDHYSSGSTGTSMWGVSLAPLPAVYLSYVDGDHQPPSASGRVALGPLWVSSTWTPTYQVVDGLVQIGRHLSVFASSQDRYALTFVALPVGLQLGRTGKVTTAKLTYGPVPPSPFSPPVIP